MARSKTEGDARHRRRCFEAGQGTSLAATSARKNAFLPQFSDGVDLHVKWTPFTHSARATLLRIVTKNAVLWFEGSQTEPEMSIFSNSSKPRMQQPGSATIIEEKLKIRSDSKTRYSTCGGQYRTSSGGNKDLWPSRKCMRGDPELAHPTADVLLYA